MYLFILYKRILNAIIILEAIVYINILFMSFLFHTIKMIEHRVLNKYIK